MSDIERFRLCMHDRLAIDCHTCFPTRSVHLKRRLDDAGQPYDVERSMSALAIGRAIHAAGQIRAISVPPVRVSGCVRCPFLVGRHCRLTRATFSTPVIETTVRTLMPGCPLSGGPVLVQLEER